MKSLMPHWHIKEAFSKMNELVYPQFVEGNVFPKSFFTEFAYAN